MASGYALLVGLKEVNPAFYNNDRMTKGTWASEKDVDRMASILKSQGFNITTLKTQQATRSQVRKQLERHILSLSPGDILVFFYSGHGGTRLDWDGDESDGKDETLCLYDGHWVDDEFLPLWEQAPAGARLLIIADSCHSETVFKNALGYPKIIPRLFMDEMAGHAMQTMLLHLGGALDPENAIGDETTGVLTKAIEMTWDGGKFKGNYEAFFKEVIRLCKRWQNAAFHTFGPTNRAFLEEKPFTI